MMNALSTLNAIAGTVLASLLNSLAIAVIIALAGLLIMRLARRLNAATRHAAWWIVFTAVLAIAPARSLVSLLDFPEQPVVSAPAELEDAASVPAPGTVVPAATGAEAAGGEGVNAGYLPLFLIALGMAAFFLQGVRVLCSYRYLQALKRSGVPPPESLKLSFDEWVIGCAVRRPVKLLLSDCVDSPIAVGFRRPAVIIPRCMIARLSGDDLDHLLLHELAHLARRDDWTNLIARLASGLVLFHPVAVWVLRRADEERELACDDWVVAMTGGAKRYALSLSRLAEFRLAQPREMLATGIGGRNSQFGDRIERLMKAPCFDSRTSAGRITFTVLILVVLLAAGARVPAWIAFAQDDPPAPPAVPSAPAEATAPPPAVHPPAAPSAPLARPAKALPAKELSVMAERALSAPVLAPVAFHPQAPAPPAPPAVAATTKVSFLQALSDAGYRDLPVEEIINLKNSGVTPKDLVALNQAGWGQLTTRQLIELRNHGVTGDYLRRVREAGLKGITLADAINLRNHGVRPEALREIHSLGFGPYDVKQAINLSNHGVRPEFFQALKDAGFGQAELAEILEAQMHGLSASALREARKYGSQLTLRQIIRLKQAGVI
jgi:beta-lactamase regulating signal transducer with metallopeptidase domain